MKLSDTYHDNDVINLVYAKLPNIPNYYWRRHIYSTKSAAVDLKDCAVIARMAAHSTNFVYHNNTCYLGHYWSGDALGAPFTYSLDNVYVERCKSIANIAPTLFYLSFFFYRGQRLVQVRL